MAFKPYVIGKKARPFKALFWGPSSMGKTTFAASGALHPDLKGMLFLNIEDGLLSIPDGSGASAIDIGVDENGVRVDVTDALENVIEELLAPKPKPEWAGFNTIVVDSVSDFQTKSLQDILAGDPKAVDKDMLQQNHYGKDTNRQKRIFSILRSCKLNVIFTALAKTVNDKEGNPIAILPALTDKVAESLVGYMDFSWYFYQDDKGVHKILTIPRGKIRAKTRNIEIVKAIGDIIPLPIGEQNLANIYSKIKPFLTGDKV